LYGIIIYTCGNKVKVKFDFGHDVFTIMVENVQNVKNITSVSFVTNHFSYNVITNKHQIKVILDFDNDAFYCFGGMPPEKVQIVKKYWFQDDNFSFI